MLDKNLALDKPTPSQLEYRDVLETIITDLHKTINELTRRLSQPLSDEVFSKAMGIECSDIRECNMDEDNIEYWTGDDTGYSKTISKTELQEKCIENNVDYDLLINRLTTGERMLFRIVRFGQYKIPKDTIAHFSGLTDDDLNGYYRDLKEHLKGSVTLNKTVSGSFVVKVNVADVPNIPFGEDLRIAKEIFVCVAMSYELEDISQIEEEV